MANERVRDEMSVVAANAQVKTASYKETGNKRKDFKMHGETQYEEL